MRFLIFGDVVGELGRKAVTAMLPVWREKYQPDAVIINIENIAHGYGISQATFEEAAKWKAQVYTTGDHAWDNSQSTSLLEDKSLPIIRPANYPSQAPGRGYHIFSIGAFSVAVINLQGQVFFKNHPMNPFHHLEELLKKPDIAAARVKLLDFHAEATSEKRGMVWQFDGKISGMWGTHTHVPTADAQIMPGGTGYISDVGMNGAYRSIIGMDMAGPLKMFLTQRKEKFEPATAGEAEANAVFMEVDPQSGKTINIAQLREIVKDK
ncbi:MAG: YmdB family metallophosphoesterase [Candidatus Andersenbacteria bacterium]|nr:YmdB family metallophosphoesterase [Candidatus Andersenbacteria bacterium]